MKNKEKGSVLVSGLIELGVVTLLVIAILGTLNYFNILPLSNTFSFLSFLPKQKSSGSKNFTKSLSDTTNKQPVNNNSKFKIDNVVVRQVIQEGNDQVFANNEEKNSGKLIEKSTMKVSGKIIIDLKATLNSTSDALSGIFFGNGPGSKDPKNLLVFYYPKNNAWGLKYQHGKNDPIFLPLYKNKDAGVQITCSLIISGDGKTIDVVGKGFPLKTFHLPESLYDNSKEIKAIAIIAPKSNLIVNLLRYKYSRPITNNQ